MIVSIFLYIFSWILYLFKVVFSTVEFAIPDQVSQSVNYFLGYFGYVKGIFPVDVLFSALGIYLSFLLLYYTVKLFIWAFGLVPFLGRVVHMPDLHPGEDEWGRTQGEYMREQRLRNPSYWKYKDRLK